MTLNEWNMFADLAEQCKEAMCSSINVASKVRSEAVIAAYEQLQTQQAAILYVRDSLLQFGYAATEKNLHLDAKFNDVLQLLDGCGMVLDIALTGEPIPTLAIPILGEITGGAEDEELWARVHAFFGGDVDPPTELPLHPDAAELPQYDNVSCDCGLCAGTNGTL